MRWWTPVLVLSFLGLVSVYALEFRYINLYLEQGRFLKTAAGLGALTGLLLAFFLARRQRDTYDRVRLAIGLFFTALLFFPLLFSLSNRWLGTRKPVPVSMEFVELEGRYSSRFGLPGQGEKVEPNVFHLYFYNDRRLQRLILEKPLFAHLERGVTFSLPVRRGAWGFDWVDTRDLSE